MMREDNIRIVIGNANINCVHNIRPPRNIFGGKIQNLNIPNSKSMQRIGTLSYSDIIFSLNFTINIGIPRFTHDENLYFMSIFNCFSKCPPTRNFNIIQMCSNS